MKVYLGDENASSIERLETILSDMGHEVKLKASSIDSLMAGTQKRDPDLLIVDVFMGEFPGGFEIGEACRKKGIPVVYKLSKEPSVDIVSKYPGCVWLREPIHGDDLKRAIDDAVKRPKPSADDLTVVEPLSIIATNMTPEVNGDPENGILEIKGKSIPEDASWFYKNVADWIERYVKHTRSDLSIDMVLEYYNTNSQQALNVMFQVCARVAKQYKVNTVVRWHYEEDDLDMEETGEDLQRRLPIAVELVPAERLDFK